MKDPSRINQELIEENVSLKQRIQKLEQLESDRKRTEEALHELTVKVGEQELYHILVEMASEGIWLLDKKFMTVYVNPAMQDMLGYAKEEMIGQSWYYFGDPGWVARAKELEKRRERGVKEPHSFLFIHKDGRKVLARISTTPLYDQDGNFNGALGILSDITRQNEAEEALRKNQALLNEMGKMAKVGGWELDADTLEVRWTEETYRIHELPPGSTPPLEEAINYFHPEEHEKLSDSIQRAFKYGEAYDMELRFITAKGKHLWTRTICIPQVVDGKTVRLNGTFQDITEHKRIEKALWEREHHLHGIIDGSPIPTFVIGKDHRVTHWNKALEEISKIRPAEVLGTCEHWKAFYNKERPCMADLLVGESIELVPQWYSGKYIKSPLIEDAYEATDFFPALGEVGKWLRITAAAVRDSNGMIVAAIETLEDITERKQAEEALKESEEKFRTIFENSSSAMAIIERDTTISMVNREYSKIGLFEEKDVIGKSWTAQIPPGDLERLKEYNRKRLIDPKSAPDHYEFTFYRKDGKIRHSLMSVAIIPTSQKIVCSFADITERKQAEEERQVIQERLAMAQEIAHVGSWEYNLETAEIWGSEEAARIYGLPTETGGFPIDQVESCIPEREMVRQALVDLIECEKSYNLVFAINPEDGTKQKFISSIARLIRDEKGKPLKVVGVIHDITDRKQAEADKEKLEAQNRQLQKTESLGRMAGAIAHTFNNQLGVVIGNLELALMDLPQGSKPVNSLTTSMRAASKAAAVSGQMLTYLGQSFDKRELLDLAETCNRYLPILKATLPGNVALETSLPSTGPSVMANDNQIQQVLTNLITNAWEAVSAGRGSIHLNVKTVSRADIPQSHRFPVGWQPQDSVYACMEVADTGDGIAHNDIEKIFDPFFSSKFTGRGLGLAMVLGIVKAHGGVITVESEPVRGSTFRVFLPLYVEEVPRQPVQTIQASAIEVGGTVLLVEDEVMVRNMAAAMLNRLGFSVLEAKDGAEAVEVFRQRQDEIRLVLSDLTMPHMDGWETLTALRKLAPDIPVILASGYDKAQVMSGDHPELPQVFLGKPYRLKELSDAISQALQKINESYNEKDISNDHMLKKETGKYQKGCQ